MTTYSTLFRNRSLLILGFSESVSGVGNWITMMAVYALVVFRGDGSVIQTSAIFVAGLLPTLIASPAAGWLCDRYDRKHLMIASELLSGLFIAGLIFVSRLEWILAIIALQAISISLMTPARQAVVPSLVARNDLTRANAFLQQLAGIIKIGAPMLAGLILTVMNPHQAVILDIISFLLSALILSRLPSLPPHKAEITSQTDHAGSSQDGLLPALRSLPLLRLLFAITFLAILIIIGFDILAPIFTRDILHQDEKFFGLIIGLVGLGTLAVSFLLMGRKTNQNLWKDILLGLILLGCIPFALALSVNLSDPILRNALVVSASLVGGAGNGLLIIQSGTLLQTLTPPALLGRMGGVYQSAAVAGQMVGILLTPLLVPAIMPIASFFIASALAVLILVLASAFLLRVEIAPLSRSSVQSVIK
jgi:MFS family permease